MRMDDETGLAGLIEAAAGRVGEVSTADQTGTTEYRRAGRAFVAVSGAVVEFRLHPDVAEAAQRTPDAGPSARGGEWVRFAPAELDQHARDRIEAWFLSAWRARG
jgi:hypothetical protein